MRILHSVEKEDGTYVYQGEFTGRELNFLTETAINYLLSRGAFPFIMQETATEVQPHSAPDMEQ